MLKIENTEVFGWEAAIRGMRNPMNSWDKSDSFCDRRGCHECPDNTKCDNYNYDMDDLPCFRSDAKNFHYLGPNDHKLMMSLIKAGTADSKFRRMINVTMDVTAPLYWWKEADTYKVGTVANSCSTMHKIHAKEFTLEDFSCEHLMAREEKDFTAVTVNGETCMYSPLHFMVMTCQVLNHYRQEFLDTKDKKYWWQMIQLLPTSYNQRRTLQMNYEVLAKIYRERRNHKLDEWHVFCDWIKTLPYSELITLEEKE